MNSDRLLHASRIAAWVCSALLVVASWTPGSAMIRTGYSGLLEHAVAYGVTAAAFMIGYPRVAALRIAGALSILSVVLEAGQLFVPGRFAGLLDGLAGVVGTGLTVIVLQILPNRRAT